jgi:hypothetical protein
VYLKSWTNNLKIGFLFVKIQFKERNSIMDKRSKRYTDEFKMLILELLEEGRTKKSMENEYVHNERFENL